MIQFAENKHREVDPGPNRNSGTESRPGTGFSFAETAIVRNLHKQAPGFEQTPLVRLSSFARSVGVREVLVKDESTRFGLKAFKGLGGIYAVFRIICRELNLDPKSTTIKMLQEEPFASGIRQMTFVTTTDGNHGKGVSWAAKVFGCRAKVFMPVGTVEVRAQAIRDAGDAEVTITQMHYDECVARTAELARQNGWYLVQDTSWEGYEDIPLWIMQGYTTLYYEALRQMREMGYQAPTHIFLQAGVGSMAGAVAAAAVSTGAALEDMDGACTTGAGLIGTGAALEDLDGACTTGAGLTGTGTDMDGEDMADEPPGKPPVIVTVESAEAACFFDSFLEGSGKPIPAHGSEITIMAGLNCSVPCSLAWNILGKYAVGGFACSDDVTRRGMRLLAKPYGDDPAIVSGESGAVSAGLLDLLQKEPAFRDMARKLRLNSESVVLLISTEGDTDPENYLRVVGKDG